MSSTRSQHAGAEGRRSPDPEVRAAQRWCTSQQERDLHVFAGDQYAGLSETCLYYSGGIIKHTKAINALTNATTNRVIDAYIGLKMQEVTRYRMTTHPVEYDMYYSV
jgi:glutamine synthetase